MSEDGPHDEWGKSKYKQMGRRYRLDIEKLAEERLRSISKTIENHGLKVIIGY
jgi:hypothetical protein